MKVYKIKPSVKQKKVFQEVIKGSSFRKAMIKAGYSAKSAINPKNVTSSLGWKQLTESFIPDDLLLRVHREGLFGENPATRHRYLETAYKIKGRYPKEGINTAIQINIEEDRRKYE